MAGLSKWLVSAAAGVTALLTIAGSGAWVSEEHSDIRAEIVNKATELVPHSEFDAHLSEQRVRTVFEYLTQIEQKGPQAWLCRGLREELLQLCTEIPNHAICGDRTEIIEEAGC